MKQILRAVGCLLGWGMVGLIALVQMGLRLLSLLMVFIGFFIFVFLILFMLLGHISPLSPKLAVVWGNWFQFLAGLIVLLVLDFGLSLIQGGTIACMSFRKQ